MEELGERSWYLTVMGENWERCEGDFGNNEFSFGCFSFTMLDAVAEFDYS